MEDRIKLVIERYCSLSSFHDSIQIDGIFDLGLKSISFTST